MAKFVIQPHFRLQECVAEGKGYFASEGLDYEFRERLNSSEAKNHNLGDKVGAYQCLTAGNRRQPQARRKSYTRIIPTRWWAI
jgi:hypothetical protein